MDTNSVTATEMRQLAEGSGVSLKRIYKLIKEAAREGEVSFVYGFASNMSNIAVKHIVEDLEAHGFECFVRNSFLDECGEECEEPVIDLSTEKVLTNARLIISW